MFGRRGLTESGHRSGGPRPRVAGGALLAVVLCAAMIDLTGGASRAAAHLLTTNSREPKPIATTTTAATSTSTTTSSTAAGVMQQTSQQLQLEGKCALRSSCRAPAPSLADADWPLLAGGPKQLCHCDQRCLKYDDCCQDSPFAEPLLRRLELAAGELRQRRRDFQCRRVSSMHSPSEAVLMRAKCSPIWLRSQPDQEFAELTRQKCELWAAAAGPQRANGSQAARPKLPDDWLQADPMGGMIPITDTQSGVTYLNSHCVRCNMQDTTIEQIARARQLVFWTPLVKCNYDAELDDRNQLYNLLASHRGQALRYSHKRRRWYINMEAAAGAGAGANRSATTPSAAAAAASATTLLQLLHTAEQQEPGVSGRLRPGAEESAGLADEDSLEGGGGRSCSITPTIPEQVERLVRRCRANVIDSCRAPARPDDCEKMRRARLECEHGHQALVYSQTSGSVYFNLACARCNRDRGPIDCVPRPRKVPLPSLISETTTLDPSGPTTTSSKSGRLEGRQEAAAPVAPDESFEGEADEAGDEEGELEVEVGARPRSGSSGSFAVLFDMEILRATSETTGAAGAEVGQASRCRGSQYFDVFLNKCRCAICGISKRYINGACVPISEQELASNLVGLEQPVQVVGSSGGGGGGGSDNTSEPLASSPSAQQQAGSSGRAEGGQRDKTPRNMTTGDEFAAAAAAAAGAVDGQAAQAEPTKAASGQEAAAAVDEDERRAKDQAAPSALPLIRGAEPAEPALTDERVFSRLNELPWPSQESRRLFAECAKTLIAPNHYRLFTMTDLVQFERRQAAAATTRPTATLGAVPLAAAAPAGQTETTETSTSAEPSSARRAPVEGAGQLVWAYVAPYNLTLASSQFELVRLGLLEEQLAATTSGGQAGELFGLHICLPPMPNMRAKFDAPMVWLTTAGLAVSIASLVLYLILYCLSTFDLRHLVVRMSQAGQASDSLRNAALSLKYRQSSASNDTSYNATRSRSLSSRGVACLAGSLLAAYLLFILGHRQQEQADGAGDELRAAQQQQQQQQQQTSQPAGGWQLSECKVIAALTYCFFLMAFNWMFLLSYDIWRILRLATYQLRAPVMSSQARRFLVYAALATSTAVLVTCLALAVDQLATCNQQHHSCDHPATTQAPPDQPAWHLNLERFLHAYQPRFGQRAGSCWFSNRRALALFFGLPVTLIMLANLLFFLHSSYMVIRTSSRSQIKSSGSGGGGGGAQQGHAYATRTTIVTGASASQPCSPSICLPADNQPDFAQQNGLTTSSISSVRTIQSALSIESENQASRCGSNSSGASLSDFYEDEQAGVAPDGATITTDGAQTDRLSPDDAKRFKRQLAALNLDQAQQFQQQQQQALQAGQPEQRPTSEPSMAPTPPLHIQIAKQISSSSLVSRTSSNQSGTSLASNLAQRYDVGKSNLSAFVKTVTKDYRLYCRLSTIMGLTWLTGLMASLVDQSALLWYLFVVLNTLQGLFIFIAFGFKRSRLTNLEILTNFVAFKLRSWWTNSFSSCCRRRPDGVASASK